MRGIEVREKPDHHLSTGTVWLMATASGITVANIYYNQPLLSVFSGYFHVEAWKSGLVATAAQVGYGLGLLFFVPLGDLLERRRLIVFLINACAVCLVAAAVAPNLPLLIFAQLLVGLCAISAQILIPLVAEMARPEERGRLIGAIMSGILCGILLGRVVAGFVSDLFGWRTVYFAAAAAMVGLGLILRSRLPHRLPNVSMSYGRLMHSMLELLRDAAGALGRFADQRLVVRGLQRFLDDALLLPGRSFSFGRCGSGAFRHHRVDRRGGGAVGGNLVGPEGLRLHDHAVAYSHGAIVYPDGPLVDDRRACHRRAVDGPGGAGDPSGGASERDFAFAGSALPAGTRCTWSPDSAAGPAVRRWGRWPGRRRSGRGSAAFVLG